MRQVLLPYGVEGTKVADTVPGWAGLALVVETMRASLDLPTIIKEEVHIRRRAGGHSEVEMIEAVVTLLASGGQCIDGMSVLRADRGLCRRMQRGVFSMNFTTRG